MSGFHPIDLCPFPVRVGNDMFCYCLPRSTSYAGIHTDYKNLQQDSIRLQEEARVLTMGLTSRNANDPDWYTDTMNELEAKIAAFEREPRKSKSTSKYSEKKSPAVHETGHALGRPVAGSEIAVRPDKVVSPFKNYERPVASPKMEVMLPTETDTGMVLPPLPKHVCELPDAVEKDKGKWGSGFDKDITETVVIPDGTVFECVCGQDWYVTVRKIPLHAADYKGQHAFGWHKVRWFNFGRKADIRKRKAT